MFNFFFFFFFVHVKALPLAPKSQHFDIRNSFIAHHTWCNYHVVDRCRILNGKKKVKNWKVIKLSNLKVEISVYFRIVYLVEIKIFFTESTVDKVKM